MAAALDWEYNMDHPRTGHALVFNHVNFNGKPRMRRIGSHKDAKRLVDTLDTLGFSVQVYEDMTSKQVRSIVETLARQDHSHCDCVLVVVLSHGGEWLEGNILATDREYHESMLWKPFLPDTCPSLAGKPKLFIFQVCRGPGLDPGFYLRSTGVDACSQADYGDDYKTAIMADFLLAYSSTKGYISFRNKMEGSWYIQSLCDVLATQAFSLDLISILVRVSYIVARNFESSSEKPLYNHKKQIPQFTSTLTRSLTFKQKSKSLNENAPLPYVPSTSVQSRSVDSAIQQSSISTTSTSVNSDQMFHNPQSQEEEVTMW